eukprot:6476835-Amphidinium_carterae.2
MWRAEDHKLLDQDHPQRKEITAFACRCIDRGKLPHKYHLPNCGCLNLLKDESSASRQTNNSAHLSSSCNK